MKCMKKPPQIFKSEVPTELFEQLKAYLKRNGIKQNAFFLDCIRQALAEDVGAEE